MLERLKSIHYMFWASLIFYAFSHPTCSDWGASCLAFIG